nr:DUF4446 family protein [Brevibacillus dissolubilis]
MLVCLLLILLMFFVIIFQGIRIKGLQRKLNRLFTKSGGGSMEEALFRLLDQMDAYSEKQNDQQFVLNRLSQKVSNQAANLSVVRYNAFGDTGSDLSFSLALLDDHQNGVVITSIYGREESRTYAKPIESGKSPYNLSDEELMVMKKATTSMQKIEQNR